MTLDPTARSPRSALLICPDCAGQLHGEHKSASLACPNGHHFPVVRGVPRFVSSEDYAESFGVEWKRFPRVQLDSYNGTRISWTRFKLLTGMEPEELSGKTVLDVGCGPGRFLELVVRAGADAYGADLSDAAEVAHRNLGSQGNCTIVQADLFRLPFKEDGFDFVYSFGVLHHTPDPEDAFRKLVSHVRPGGKLAVWVYGLGVSTGVRWRWIPRPHQVFGRLFKLLPSGPRKAALDGFTRFALAAGALPVAGRLLKHVFYIQDLRRAGPINDGWEEGGGDRDKRERIRLEWAQHSAYDAYTPHYQVQTPHEEVVRWARDAGLIDIRKSPIPSGIVATRPA